MDLGAIVRLLAAAETRDIDTLAGHDNSLSMTIIIMTEHLTTKLQSQQQRAYNHRSINQLSKPAAPRPHLVSRPAAHLAHLV